MSNQGGAQWRVEGRSESGLRAAFTLEEMYEKLGWVSEHGPISATAPMRLSRQIVNERRSSLQGTNYAVFVKDDPTGMGVCVPYADGRGFRPLWLTGTALKKAVQSANLDLLQQTDTWATVAADEGDPGTLLLLGRIFCVADDIVLSRRGRRLLKTAYKLLRNKHMLKRLKELGH